MQTLQRVYTIEKFLCLYAEAGSTDDKKKQTKIIYIIHNTILPLLQLGNALEIKSCVDKFVKC